MGHIGRYTILQEIGRGGMGVVYRCQAPSGEAVAIKVLLDHGSATEAQRRRFVREADALAQLDHPALVKVREHGTQGQNPFLVLDFVPGRSLGEVLEERGRLPAREAAALIAGVARGLAHAHARGVVHRDVKPDNIRITPQGQPVLVDFGLAKSVDLAHSRLTQAGRMLGTPGFWPPEQVVGDLAAIGPPSDVFALGATLFTLLTGRPPFEGETLLELTASVQQPPPLPRTLEPSVPARLEAIVMRCMERDPGARYPTAGELSETIEAWLNQEPGLEAPGLEAPGLEAPGREAPRPDPPASEVRRGPLVAGLLLVLAAGGGVAWFTAGPPSQPAVKPAPASTGPTAVPTPTPTPAASPSATVAPPALVPRDEGADEAARRAILAGVSRLAFATQVPSPVIAYGPRAFPVLTARERGQLGVQRPYVAAARYGAGRVVAFGHDDALRGPLLDTDAGSARLLFNAATWAAPGPVVLLGRSAKGAATLAKVLERPVRLIARVSEIGEARLVVWDREAPAPTTDESALLLAHVRAGGGVILARCGWGQQQVQAKQRSDYRLRDDMPENWFLAPLGLVFDAQGYLDGSPAKEFHVRDSDPGAHAGANLEAILRAGSARFGPEAYRAGRLLVSVSKLDRLVIARVTHLRPSLEIAPPSPSRPAQVDVRLRLLERAAYRAWETALPDEVEPAPGVEAFPGGVPASVERGQVRLGMKRVRVWSTTRSYAPPGEPITVSIDPFVPGFWVQIGVHPDRPEGNAWPRWPRIRRGTEITSATQTIASPFGGPIHVSFRGNLLGDPCTITLDGVVSAPRYDARAKRWSPSLDAPAPWGELAAPGITISAPTSILRQVADPMLPLRSWAALLMRSTRFIPQPKSVAPFWFVFDLPPALAPQPFPYPIPLALAPEPGGVPAGLVPSKIPSTGHLTLVALHLTRQWASAIDRDAITLLLLFSLVDVSKRWTTAFSTRCIQEVQALRRSGGVQAVASALRSNKSLVVAQLYELRQQFGWALFERTFTRLSKRSRPLRAERAREDAWVEGLSRAAGRNLVPFFRLRWGRDVGPTVEQRLAKLEAWVGPPR